MDLKQMEMMKRRRKTGAIGWLQDLFAIEAKPRKGLLAAEWVVLAYAVATMLLVFFCYTKLANPESMVAGRLRVMAMMAMLWAVYRLLPCRFTLMLRLLVLMLLLGWWYPDTYEINRIFTNLDHSFASAEQWLFGFQPALEFCRHFPSKLFSSLMYLGYGSYYPLIALTAFWYFLCRYKDFERCAFVIITAFFIYYVIYDFVPVVGPTFYFKAVGLQDIAHGVFPALGDYFNTHTDCLPAPGYHDTVFYKFVEYARLQGERPTAAFPSSHVGVATICLLFAIHSRRKWLIILMAPLYVLLCLSTVYIQAHYAIDALAGLATGLILYFVLMALSRRLC